MRFNKHSDLEGKHAFLSPSQYHWIRYDDQKLEARYWSYKAAARGTALHDFAKNAILLRIKLSKANATMSMYVSDALHYNMKTEQSLRYSDNCFGTADAISFRRNTLRIHDLKTGVGKTSFEQLRVYAAIFCLEYDINPNNIEMNFRIYQNGEVEIEDGDPNQILEIMEKIVYADEYIEKLKEGGL